MRLFLAHVFQYLPCWDSRRSSWAGFRACFLQRKFSKMHWKEKSSLRFGNFSTQSIFLFCVNLPPGVVCVHMPPFRDSLKEQLAQKHLEVWQLRSLCIIHPRMYRKCPKTWQAAWLMPFGGGNWMNKWYSLSFCNFFGGKRGQTLAKVRRRMI